MTIKTDDAYITKAAKGVRGRFGTDVWQKWCNLGMHEQQDWMHKQEPSACPVLMRLKMMGILWREDIRRTEYAECCNTCTKPIGCQP